jgi:hypothetical protein
VNGKPKFDFLDMAKAIARRVRVPENALSKGTQCQLLESLTRMSTKYNQVDAVGLDDLRN